MGIHILGLGPIGCLVAHHLRLALPAEKITLVLRPRRLDELHRIGGAIKVSLHEHTSHSTGFDTELTEDTGAGRPIETLFVATKAHAVVSAIAPLVPHLSPLSTIILLQNGMGIHEEVVETLFPAPGARPHFILASNTHGAWQRGPFDIAHEGLGTITFGVASDTLGDMVHTEGASPRQTLHILLRHLESLNTVRKPIVEVQHAMRLKLAVNAVINPLTAILGLPNGESFNVPSSRITAKAVCEEIARAYAADVPSSSSPLDAKTLENECIRVAGLTVNNVSSMLSDVRNGRKTEIDYINGYLLRIGLKHGISMPETRMLYEQVKALPG